MEKRRASKPSSNQRRTIWRTRCRKRLSEHIGLQVDPDEVRLQPDDETHYAWQIDDLDLKPIFDKSLSKHSVGAYVELCSEVGKSFRAVNRDQVGKAVRSTRERVQILEEEKIELENAMGNATEQSQALRDEKVELEKQLRDAAKQVTEMEQAIVALENKVNEHQKEAKEWMSVAECYERTYTQCSTGLNQAILFLQTVCADTPLLGSDVKLAV
ncbi:hypothetical protein BDV18DRAFT_163807 [Aspergillus unguis]